MGMMKEELEHRLDLHKWEMLDALRLIQSLFRDSSVRCIQKCREAELQVTEILAKIETLTDPKP